MALLKKFIKFCLLLAVILPLNLSFKADAASDATYSFSPGASSRNVNESFTINLVVNSGSQAINSGEGTVSYSSNILELSSVTTTGSIFTFWTRHPAAGAVVSFGGGLATPGFSGSGGRVLSLNFKAKSAGTASLSVSGGKILANDGLGTNVFGGASAGSVTVNLIKSLPSVRSSTHPDQNKWYNNKNAAISWSGGTGATGYVWSFDHSAATQPTGNASKTYSANFNNSADGIWYFHLKAQTADGWLTTVHFKVQIDTVPPNTFSVNINTSDGASKSQPKLTFEAKDDTSGIDRYELIIDGGTPIPFKSGDSLPKLSAGKHTLTIKAYDKAGNVREASTTYSLTGSHQPIIAKWSKSVVITNPVYFVGYADRDATIIVYLNGKEVDRFKVKDKLSSGKTALGHFATEQDGKSLFEYIYDKDFMPGKHDFQFVSIDKNDVESEKTKEYPVKVLTCAVSLFGLLLSTSLIIIILLGLILALLILLGYKYLRRLDIKITFHKKILRRKK